MKIANSKNKSKVIGKTTYEESFSIGNTSRIIGILRNSMYSNPIQSIIREISCNARDAHREIGTPDRPIKITLPTQLSSIFSIKDYGLGISPDRMSSIFVKYGNSTKNDDNVQTGGFGLGAKTPFAYSDQFNITTIVKEEDYHVKRIYTAYIDESESGKMRLSFEGKTDEDTGTEISIHINKKDEDTFIEEIYKSLLFFTVKPEINNDSIKQRWDSYNNNDDLFFNSEKGKLYKKNTYKNNYRSIVLIDDIPYPLSFKDLNIDENNKDNDYVSLITDFSIIIHANNGELTLSSNRENLQYDQSTKNKILNKLKNLHNDFVNYVNENIKDCEHLTEVNSVIQYIFNGYNCRYQQKIPFIWKGSSIDKNIIIKNEIITNINKVELFVQKEHIGFTKNNINANVHNLNNITNKVYIINDTKNGFIPRKYILKYIIKNNKENKTKIKEIIEKFLTKENLQQTPKYSYNYLIQCIQNQYDTTYDKLPNELKYVVKNSIDTFYTVLSYDSSKYNANDIVKILESKSKANHIKTIKSSDIINIIKNIEKINKPLPSKEIILKKEKNDLFAGKFRYIKNDSTTCAYLKEYPTKGIIVILSDSTHNINGIISKYNYNIVFSSYVESQTLYAIKKQYYEKIKSKIKLKTLDEWVDDEIDKKKISKEQVEDFYVIEKRIKEIKNIYPIFSISSNSIINKKSDIINIIKELEEFDKYISSNLISMGLMEKVYGINKYNILSNKYDDKFDNYKYKIDTNYPLLSLFNKKYNNYIYCPTKHITDYINGIDLLKGNTANG